MTQEVKTYNQISFAEEVEKMVASGQEDSYIAAVSALFEEMDVEPEEATHLVSKTLVGKMEAEANERRLLKNRPSSKKLVNFAPAK